AQSVAVLRQTRGQPALRCKIQLHEHQFKTALGSNNTDLEGILSSRRVPGSALVSRNSPPNSLARCFMPPMPTPTLSGRRSATLLSIPLPSSSTDPTISPSF